MLRLVLLFLVLFPVSSQAAISGTYKGETNQNRTAHVTIKKGKIKSLSFSVFSACGIGGSKGYITDILYVENLKLKANGSYSFTEKGDQTNGYASFTIKGKATAKKVTGSVEHFFRNGCQAFELKFTAKKTK